MTRPKAIIVVSILALACAGIAALLTFKYLQKETDKSKAIQPQNIVVAATDIPIGSIITEQQLKIASWPKDSIPPGSSSDIKATAGRVVIRSISNGDAITEQKLKPKAGEPGSGFMTYIIPSGHRAITVAVNEVAGVAGFITPSDRVDIVLTTQRPGVQNENISKIILQNVPVLATGQITNQKEGKPVIVPTVTLDLTPDDSERLVLAGSKGTLQLLLRNITDSAPVDSKGATISKVLTGTAQPIAFTVLATHPGNKAGAKKRTVRRKAPARARVFTAAPAPRQSHTVTLIDGGARTTKEFVLQ